MTAAKTAWPFASSKSGRFVGGASPQKQNSNAISAEIPVEDDARASRNALFAMLLFLGADLMFFSGLIGAFLVFRLGSLDWPPAGMPRLPIGVTSANTFVLLASGFTMMRTWSRLRSGHLQKIRTGLLVTLSLGLAFLLVQGFEWASMMSFGLTISRGVFGGIFYVLIGSHAIHVAGALIFLTVIWARLPKRPNCSPRTSVKLAGLYWFLVVLLWPVIYLLVYWS